MKNKNISLLDGEQIIRRQFDEETDAQRVVLVGGDGEQIAESIKDSLKDLKIEVPKFELQPAIDPLVIKIPYQTVVKELEIKEIEKPVYITEVKIVEVEKVITVPEYRVVQIPNASVLIPKVIIWLLGVQVVISFISVLLTLGHK